ncbi:hypothetical protein Poli38472_005050 [Pythium oligandrum]|uniref:glucan 1,3-beta-glucosidase n=1 Tax=Pythium oligandrum TaxID=41045 RepID=A0A8K1FK43_PYTOL|nr:hypothetical protein Poli38472_005050 [Pythium oligandrum]|eukprot:TMW62432.1 hypothetical protein Poli38472_005050 [Pythium oligandrum]
MAFKRVLAVALCALGALTDAKITDHVQYKIRYGELAPRAVNLGGWLCAEYWMSYNSPLWKDVPKKVALNGEYATMQYLGQEKGTEAFESHWSTWITEEDIKTISKTGLNTVRVTTGFWIVNDEDDSKSSDVSKTYARGSLKYLDKLINVWGEKYNLAVMVSLHALEGSQNGMDHSAPAVSGTVGWGANESTIDSSIQFASFIADRYKDSPAFLGLNLMNEPNFPIPYDTLLPYYEKAYKKIRDAKNDCILVTSPLLYNQGPGAMDDYMPCPDYYNVWHEYHIYFKWGWENVAKDEIMRQAGTYRASHIDPWKGNPLFIGEWSLATPYESDLSDEDFAKFAAIQIKEYEAARAGWAFWAWRHDDEKNATSAWSMRQLLEKGIISIPKDAPVRTKEVDSKCPTVDLETLMLSDGSSKDGSTEAGSDAGNSSTAKPKEDSPSSSQVTPEPSSAKRLVVAISAVVVSMAALLL